MKFLPRSILLTFALGATGLQAQTIVASSVFDSTNVIINNIFSDTVAPFSNERDLRFRTGGADRDLGQTFTLATPAQIKAITVRVSDNNSNSLQSGALGAAFTLRLYSTTDVNSLTAGDYTLLTSIGYTFPATAARGDYIRMEFDTPYSLSAGGYAFVLGWDQEAANRIAKLHHSGAISAAQYAGGIGLEHNFGSGTGDARPALALSQLDGSEGRDLSFAVSVIPEPSVTALLAGVGALALVLRRRLRRDRSA